MKRAMFFLVAAPIVLAASGMATAACKGGPEAGDAGGDDLGSLEKSSGSEDCIAKGEHEDAACPEDGGAGD